MNIIKGVSTRPQAEDAVSEIKTQFGEFSGRLVVYFGSSAYDQNKLGLAMRAAFPDSRVIGCSTAGEIVSGLMLTHSLVAMGLNGGVIEDVKLAVIEGIDREPDVAGAFAALESQTGIAMRDLDFKKYVGIILVDGLRGAEETIMERIGDLTDVQFIGGSAGDDLGFKQTHVCADGETYTNAAVLALIKVRSGFDIIKTQSFRDLGRKLTVTKACSASRQVLEFNGKPAVVAYAEAVGVPVENAGSCFMKNPVGLMADGEPYVRSPQRIEGESIIFYCNVLEGMELSLLESGDIVEDTAQAIRAKSAAIGPITGLINFHCILRTLELQQRNETEAYGKVFSTIPTIGFSTYGEQFCGHMNQTSTMLVFQ